VERVNQEFKRKGRVVKIFTNPQSYLRLYGEIVKEWDEDWISGRRYVEMEPLWNWGKEKILAEKELVPLPPVCPEEEKKFTVVN